MQLFLWVAVVDMCEEFTQILSTFYTCFCGNFSSTRMAARKKSQILTAGGKQTTLGHTAEHFWATFHVAVLRAETDLSCFIVFSLLPWVPALLGCSQLHSPMLWKEALLHGLGSSGPNWSLHCKHLYLHWLSICYSPGRGVQPRCCVFFCRRHPAP